MFALLLQSRRVSVGTCGMTTAYAVKVTEENADLIFKMPGVSKYSKSTKYITFLDQEITR